MTQISDLVSVAYPERSEGSQMTLIRRSEGTYDIKYRTLKGDA